MAEDNTPPAQDNIAITGRSLMVGTAASRNNSYRSQEGSVAEHSCEEEVMAQSCAETSAEDSSGSKRRRTNTRRGSKNGLNRSVSVLGTTMAAQRQAHSAAHRARERSEEETLGECLADAGLNAFGCVFVELWVMSDDGTKLIRPGGGHWMDPAFAQSLPSEILIEKAWELDRSADDCPPGAGLAGTLAEEAGSGARHVHWRQMKSLLKDPFVQRSSGRRMERLFEVGMGLVGAVPFSFQEQRGIVLYYSRSTANVELLRSVANERYLIGSADLIGANFSLRKARKESTEMRKEMFREAIKKVRKELLHQKKSLFTMVSNEEAMEALKEQRRKEAAQDVDDQIPHVPRVDRFAATMAKKAFKFGKRMARRVNNSRRKWRGAKLHGPPRQSFSDVAFVFFGSFVTMLTILKIAKTVRTDSKFDFDAGWYSSTLCIVFALTPAPVGQPRQIVCAHLWNMLMGMACRQIPDGGCGDFMDGSDCNGLPLIYKQALAVALGIAGQAKIGILHPPATGMAMTFTSKLQYSWATFASVMLTDIVVIVLGMVLLNLQEKKQYPLYWLGLGWEGSGGTIGFVRAKTRRLRSATRSLREKSSFSEKGDDVV